MLFRKMEVNPEKELRTRNGSREGWGLGLGFEKESPVFHYKPHSMTFFKIKHFISRKL